MKRCVIVGGADIGNYDFIRENLQENDYIVFCDSGLKHLERLQVKPSLIVGDFDSHENPNLDVETIVLPCEKDDTDTVFAVKEAISRGFDRFLLIGVVGGRLDHTLGNVSILLYLDSLGKKGCIIDDYSEMEIVSDTPCFINDNYAFFSLLNITGCAKGITIQNAKSLWITLKLPVSISTASATKSVRVKQQWFLYLTESCFLSRIERECGRRTVNQRDCTDLSIK